MTVLVTGAMGYGRFGIGLRMGYLQALTDRQKSGAVLISSDGEHAVLLIDAKAASLLRAS